MYRLHGFYTQNTMKTLYVLEELGVDYEFAFVNLMTGENRSDHFRALTPIGKVPVLEHDGEFLFESGSICRYVASTEKSPLFPADKLQRARVDQWMTFFTCHPGRWLTDIYFEKVIKPKANLGETDLVACEKAAKFAGQQLKALDRWFENTSWLANDALSIAEPFALAYLEQVHAIDFSLDQHPRVKDWLERLETRESTARARARVKPFMAL
ncbi:glutathione S-transferase family protein [Pseudomonadota bacterium]